MHKYTLFVLKKDIDTMHSLNFIEQFLKTALVNIEILLHLLLEKAEIFLSVVLNIELC
jgi:hypothetical protein